MKYIELFAGIGGFRSALDKLGYECVFSSEIDKYARQSYKALYDHEPSGDITKIDAYDIPDHDMIVGGFPCQAFSIAGVRKGFEDTRGTLFFEIIRIASAKNPKWLMLENVKGLLSHDGGKTFDVMCACLNDIGYAIDFKVLNSKHYGVPQNRERVFIVASLLAPHEDWRTEGTGIVAKAKKRIAGQGIRTFNFDFPDSQTVERRLRDILQTGVPEKFYLSLEKTQKLLAQFQSDQSPHRDVKKREHEIVKLFDIPRDIVRDNELQRRVYSIEGISPTACARPDTPKIVEYTDVEIIPVLTPGREEKRQNGRRFKDNDEEMFTLTAQDIHGIAIKEATKQGYAIAVDGDAVNFTQPNSETRRGRVGKQIANTLETSCNQGVVEPFGATKDECSYALTTRYDNGFLPSMFERKERTAVMENGYRIRKLTPLECWRLQGFTDEQFQRCVDAGVSDSQLYKQAGNAVTVNVIHELGCKLLHFKNKEQAKSDFSEV